MALIDLHLVETLFLGRLAGQVQGAENLLDAVAGVAHGHDADAQAGLDALALPDEADLPGSLAELVRHPQALLRRAVAEQDAEVVTAQAGHPVAVSHLLLDQFADMRDQRVASLAAQGVVDHRHPFDIHPEHAGLLAM